MKLLSFLIFIYLSKYCFQVVYAPCCFSNTTCSNITTTSCTSLGGNYGFSNMSCTPFVCTNICNSTSGLGLVFDMTTEVLNSRIFTYVPCSGFCLFNGCILYSILILFALLSIGIILLGIVMIVIFCKCTGNGKENNDDYVGVSQETEEN